MTRLLDSNGAQVLPPVNDPRAIVTGWVAVRCVDADLRVRSVVHRELAGHLFIEAVPE